MLLGPSPSDSKGRTTPDVGVLLEFRNVRISRSIRRD
jgi:hypothetical protein